MTAQLHFPRPIVETIGTAKEAPKARLESMILLPDVEPPTYDLPLNPNWNQVSAYLKKWGENGYGKGSVVVRRFSDSWKHCTPAEWGVIGYVTPHPRQNIDWAPFSVIWIDKGVRESAWAEDLMIIFPAVPDQAIKDSIEIQKKQINGYDPT